MELPAILLVIRGGAVVQAFGTSSTEVFLLDYDAHPEAPPVESVKAELDGGFNPLYVHELYGEAVHQPLQKCDVLQ